MKGESFFLAKDDRERDWDTLMLARFLHVYSLNDAEMLFKCLKYLISKNDRIKKCLVTERSPTNFEIF